MLHHVRRGKGEPLLLLHGLGASSLVWEPVLGRLSQERDVIAVDMPGFGRSPQITGGIDPSPANLARALAEFCEEIGVECPHAAGNSLGGWVALEMAKAGAAASVTAISPAGMWGKPLGPRSRDTHAWARRLRPLLSLVLRSRRARLAMLRTTVALPERVPARVGRELILTWVDSDGYDAANREMRSRVFEPDGFPPVPVLLVWGEEDNLVAPPRPKHFPPGARYRVLPRVGHTPTWDDPALAAALLLEGSAVADVAG